MKKARGFTLIEMIVVMVILGILAAVALPKFVNMTGQARLAKMNGAVGAVQSSITLIHAKWLAQGSPTGSTPTITAEGNVSLVPDDATDMKFGYPAAETFLRTNENLAGLDANFTTTGTSATVTTITDPNGPAACAFTITESTAAGVPPVLDVSGLTEANCQ
jgi:MSHA pilin protein MshA